LTRFLAITRTKIIDIWYHNLDDFEICTSLHIALSKTRPSTTFNSILFIRSLTSTDIFHSFSVFFSRYKNWNIEVFTACARDFNYLYHHIYPDTVLFYGAGSWYCAILWWLQRHCKAENEGTDENSNDIEKTGEINEKWQKKKYILEKEEDKMEPISKGNGK